MIKTKIEDKGLADILISLYRKWRAGDTSVFKGMEELAEQAYALGDKHGWERGYEEGKELQKER